MVSIITINYNNARLTCDMLLSLQRLRIPDLEVIVVDNGSLESVQPIAEEHPWARLVRSDVNLGFAGGNNLGVKHARGDYYFFVNNDTEFREDIVTTLRNRLDADAELGLICPVLHFFDQPNKVQYAGFTAISPLTGRNRCITTVSARHGLVSTQYAHGAAMMIPKHVFQVVGQMPENYFIYYEEMDWSEMVRRAGYRIAVDRSVTLYHKESQTVVRFNEMKSYLMTRNRLLFMRRNVRPFQLMIFWLFYLLVATPKQLWVYWRSHQWNNINAHIAGILWNLRSSANAPTIGYKFNHLGKI